jgi:hypothetical protein
MATRGSRNIPDHRARLKSYLEGQLIELEQTGADETS